MMVTGDYHQTAIAVARGAGMIPGDSRVVIIQSQTEIRPSCRHPGCMHSALKCNKSAANTLLTPKRAVSFHISKANEQERTCEGLKFLLDNGDAFEDGDALSALTSIAQVMLLYNKDPGALSSMTNALGLSLPSRPQGGTCPQPFLLEFYIDCNLLFSVLLSRKQHRCKHALDLCHQGPASTSGCLGVCVLAVTLLQRHAWHPLTWPAVIHACTVGMASMTLGMLAGLVQDMHVLWGWHQ